MFIGVLRVVIQIPGARSLKDRRRVVRSYKDRLRAKLPVSVAEVGDVERTQVATLGVAVVSGDSSRCQEVLSRATSMASTLSDGVLADVATEIVSFGQGGQGVQGGIESRLGELGDDNEDNEHNDESMEEGDEAL